MGRRRKDLPTWILAGLCTFACTAPCQAAAAGPLAWSPPATIDHHSPFGVTTPLDGISCASANLCVATDGGYAGLTPGAGDVLVSTDPTAGSEGWHVLHVDGQNFVQGVSCASASLCVAVDSSGDVISSTEPAGGSGAWSVTKLNAATGLTAISCPSASLCVATDLNGDIITSTDPARGTGGWTVTHVAGAGRSWADNITGVSCPTTTFCAAVDQAGNVLTSSNPSGGLAAWSVTNVDGQHWIEDVSCASPTLCVAADYDGNLLTSTNPVGGAGAWTVTPLVKPPNLYLRGISCPSAAECVGVGLNGDVWTSSDPTGGASAWTTSDIDGFQAFAGVSCPSTQLCVAVDGDGNAVVSADANTGTPQWSIANVDGVNRVFGVSCPSVTACIAVDDGGDVVSSADPAAPGSWTVTNVDQRNPLYSVSCATAVVCVAGAGGRYAGINTPPGHFDVSSDADGGASKWVFGGLDPGGSGGISGVSCVSVSLCYGANDIGQMLRSATPTEASGQWQPVKTPLSVLTSISCLAASLCAAGGTDGTGAVAVSANPGAVSPTWKTAAIAGSTMISGVSCPAPRLCVAVGDHGTIGTSTDPTGGATAWHAFDADGPNTLKAVSCPSTLLCVAVDSAGNELSSSDPTAGPGAWSTVPVDGHQLLSISCPDGSLCVAGDDHGGVVVGRAPECPPASVTTSAGSTAAFQLACTDPLGRALSYQIISGPAHGQIVTPTRSGSVSFTADAGYHGFDGIVYRASAPDGTYNTSVVAIFVTDGFTGRQSHISIPASIVRLSGRGSGSIPVTNRNRFMVRITSLTLRSAHPVVMRGRHGIATLLRSRTAVTLHAKQTARVHFKLRGPALRFLKRVGRANLRAVLNARAPDRSRRNTAAALQFVL